MLTVFFLIEKIQGTDLKLYLIKSGISVFLFPEGTRSKTGKMGEFKDGGFKIATKSKAPVVPVGITGTNDILENHFPFIKSGKVIVSFGKPIYTTDMDRAEQKLYREKPMNR